MDESRKEKENIEPTPVPVVAPAVAPAVESDLQGAVAESWQKMNEVAGSFGVDLTTPESGQRAKQANDAGIHRLFVAPIVGHLDKFLDPALTPKLYPREFILVRHALEAGRDMLARAVDAPGQNLCRLIFKRFIQHVTSLAPRPIDFRGALASALPGDVAGLVGKLTPPPPPPMFMLHELVRTTRPEDSCEVLADIYSGFLPNLDRALFVRWFKHLNVGNRTNVYNTYLLIANGIVQVQPPYIGITDKIAEVVRALRREGQEFDIDRMLPVLETILGLFLNVLAK